MYFHYFVIIYPWKRAGPFIWINFTQGCFVPSLVEIGPVVLEKKMKMWKVYDNANEDDDNNNGQRTNFDQKSSLEPLAQVSLKRMENWINERSALLQKFCTVFLIEVCVLFTTTPCLTHTECDWSLYCLVCVWYANFIDIKDSIIVFIMIIVWKF